MGLRARRAGLLFDDTILLLGGSIENAGFKKALRNETRLAGRLPAQCFLRFGGCERMHRQGAALGLLNRVSLPKTGKRIARRPWEMLYYKKCRRRRRRRKFADAGSMTARIGVCRPFSSGRKRFCGSAGQPGSPAIGCAGVRFLSSLDMEGSNPFDFILLV